MDADIRIVAVLMFLLGVLVTFSLVRTFGDADALPKDYYIHKDGIFKWDGHTIDATKDCEGFMYSHGSCERASIILLQNEKIISLLEEMKSNQRSNEMNILLSIMKDELKYLKEGKI